MSVRPDLILVGASVRSLAQSATADGLRPFCVDMFGDADLRLTCPRPLAADEAPWYRQISSFSEVPDILSELDVSVPVMVFGGMENDPGLLRSLGQQRTLLNMSPEVIRQLKTPEILFPILKQHGCHVPSFVVSDAEPTSKPPDQPDVRWLLKHRNTCGGIGVRWLNDTPERLTPQTFRQRYISGPSMSATFMATSNRTARLIGCSAQLVGSRELNAQGFQFCGNVGPLRFNNTFTARIRRIGSTIVRQWPVKGFFGVDIVVNQGLPYVVEVNPRVTASHELYEWARKPFRSQVREQAMACNYVLRSTDECVSYEAKLPSEEQVIWARMIVYATESFRATTEECSQMLSPQGQIARSDDGGIWLADVPHAGTCIEKSSPICSVYLKNPAFFSFDDSKTEFLKRLPGRAELNSEGLSSLIQASLTNLLTEANL